MKIAQIAPLCESVPPRLYGGTERVVASLCDELVTAGHDVTLFASGDSWTRARLVAMRDRAIRLDPAPLKSEVAAHLAMMHEVHARAREFDVLHFHLDLLHFPFFEQIAQRTLTTLHGRLDLADLPLAYRRWPQYPLVAISQSQRSQLPDASWLATVHHGIPVERYRFSPRHEGTLAFVGRFSPEKRADRAVEIARRAGRDLVAAAKVDPADERYFRQQIAPLLQAPHVRCVGEVGDAEKNDILGAAAALLFPIDWPEPFGLVMTEAMACGTPVVAWDRGSVREVVEHGVTGFVVRSIDEAVEAVQRIDTIDRRRVRETFERRFSAATMARNYLQLYARLARRQPALSA
ncbi:MAG TPA: glycosyltransferase family 4 protein [Casimicrobiaceae bacterium]|nr:glycosyltransferase family 4 protein [Casimicrobiaceae bacterium]